MEQFTREHLLAILRITIGLLFLWPFFDKLFGFGFATPHGSGVIDGGSPSSFVVYVTDGLLKDFYISLAGNAFVDFMTNYAVTQIPLAIIEGILFFLFAIFLMSNKPEVFDIAAGNAKSEEPEAEAEA